jgi:hypothetical protein
MRVGGQRHAPGKGPPVPIGQEAYNSSTVLKLQPKWRGTLSIKTEVKHIAGICRYNIPAHTGPFRALVRTAYSVLSQEAFIT